MSISYLLAPVTEEMLEWGRKCGIDLPESSLCGRFPLASEIEDALVSIPDHVLQRACRQDSFEYALESRAQVPLEANPPFPASLTPETYLIVNGNVTDTAPQKWIGCHGDLCLILELTQRLVPACGPLCFFADCDGIPWFVFTPTAEPIGPERWRSD
ncbi:MAG: hypothetical protein KDA78_21335 [Planctomycetaceae bacterium]|nr:hypothetical protein [Planctomycetaceae bacterium]